MKRFATLLMALVMVLSLAMAVSAAGSSVTYKGNGDFFVVEPGSVYTDTDMFENFKGVMPGDVLEETITIKNEYKGCDYIKVSIRGLLHDGDGNPISPKVLEELKADQRNEELTELEYMHDFLDRLELKVMQGNKLIYKGYPSSLDDGLRDDVYLGSLRYGKSMTLDVTLKVPIELSNEYADRIGEVDWVFVISEFDDEDAKTGDETMILPYVLMFAVAVVGLGVLVLGKRRKKNT